MEISKPYIFHHRAVAFLDVLGFRQFLVDIDAEANENRLKSVSDDDNNILKGEYISEKANIFIDTFKTAIAGLDIRKFRYYLFSDNICITSITETNASDLQDLLVVINKLYFDFAKQGYFLRGGIDYGLFIDEESIAIGRPLAEAFELESKVAIHPRVVLSQKLVDQFQAFNKEGEKIFDYPFIDALIVANPEPDPTWHLNVFLQVFQNDFEEDRKRFFSEYQMTVLKHLSANKDNHRVYSKYRWLAEQFNVFIDKFVNELAYLDKDFDPESSEDFLTIVSQYKIELDD